MPDSELSRFAPVRQALGWDTAVSFPTFNTLLSGTREGVGRSSADPCQTHRFRPKATSTSFLPAWCGSSPENANEPPEHRPSLREPAGLSKASVRKDHALKFAKNCTVHTVCSRCLGRPESRKIIFWTAIPQSCDPSSCWFGDLELRGEGEATSLKSTAALRPENEVGTNGVSQSRRAKEEAAGGLTV